MMPVEGESSAASQWSAGSSAWAASPESVCRSGNTVGLGMRPDDPPASVPASHRCDDQLAAVSIRMPSLTAVTYSACLPLTHIRAIWLIAGHRIHMMNSLSARRSWSDPSSSFQHDDLATSLGQSPRHGKADHSRTDDDARPFPFEEYVQNVPDLLTRCGAAGKSTDCNFRVQRPGWPRVLVVACSLGQLFGFVPEVVRQIIRIQSDNLPGDWRDFPPRYSPARVRVYLIQTHEAEELRTGNARVTDG